MITEVAIGADRLVTAIVDAVAATGCQLGPGRWVRTPRSWRRLGLVVEHLRIPAVGFSAVTQPVVQPAGSWVTPGTMPGSAGERRCSLTSRFPGMKPRLKPGIPPARAGPAATAAAHNADTVTTAATPARPRLVTASPPGLRSVRYPGKSNRLQLAWNHPFR